MSARGPDLTGRRVGKLVVLRRVHRGWECRCDCGNLTIVPTGHINNGRWRSCGCLKNQGHRRTHGMSRTPELRAWESAKSRCFNPRNPKYALYGGRGITMFPEWVHNFSAFYAEVGPRPSSAYSLDRIDGDRGYEPGNLRWATIDVQNQNRRDRKNVRPNEVADLDIERGDD